MNAPDLQSPFWTEAAELAAYQDAKRPAEPSPANILNETFLAWQRERPLDLAFPMQADVTQRRAWRERARDWTTQQLAWPRTTGPLDARVHHRSEHDGYIQEEVSFVGAAPLRVPATVLTPTKGEGPFPALLALHDMGGMRAFGRQKLLSFEGEPAYLTDFRQLCYEGQSIARDLVRQGYVVMAIDAQDFGERTPRALQSPESFHRDRCQWDMAEARKFSLDISINVEPELVRNVLTVGRTWPGLVIEDDRRSLDYLETRPEVDAKRIGCIGLSFGAYRTNYLAALDERIAAAVTVCWTSTMDGVVGYSVGGAMGWFSLVPSLFARMDLPDLQALAAPRPLMVISGWQDTLMQPMGIAGAHQHLRKAWSAWEAPDRLGSLVFDCPHEFNIEMQQRSREWLDQWLRPG